MGLTEQIMWGSAVLVLCIVNHVFGIGIAMRLLMKIAKDKDHPWLRDTLFLLVAVGAVTLLHVIEVWIWAGAMMWEDLFKSLSEAIYFSLVTYTTVGYGDVVVGPEARVFAAFAAMTGALSFGISTAFLVTYISKLSRAGGPSWS
ncbi:potassium channel family protein [Chachezhania sediminis]|uniref:potassium channel family protein n=1 Tax=Chachezhania sediminis TaxID=2599291 RepID=UPI001E3935D4|nr:potassium channel family protein [Chachezhania sediminis]